MRKTPELLVDAVQRKTQVKTYIAKVISVDGNQAYVLPVSANTGFYVDIGGNVNAGDMVTVQVIGPAKSIVGPATSSSGSTSTSISVNSSSSPSTTADWYSITNKPPTFPPSVHTHDYTTLTNLPGQASGSVSGLLSYIDWNTFNSKQAAGNYITTLTGDVSASGPGSAAATVNWINGYTVYDARYALAARNVNAGTGLSGGGDLTADRTLSLGTPSTITSSSTNSTSTGTHTHAIDSTIALSARNISAGTGLSGGGNLTADRTLSVDQSFTPTWTGTHTFANSMTTRNIVPQTADTYNIGASGTNYSNLFVSNINATVFVEQSAQLFGGYLIVPKSVGTLKAASGTGTTVDFGQSMSAGIVVFRGQIGGVFYTEYMRVGTLSSAPSTYNVDRDVKNGGANPRNWPVGTPYAIYGVNGDGKIELESYNTPRISISNITDSTGSVTEAEYFRAGDITGMSGISGTKQGIFIGDATNNMYYNSTDGLVVKGKVTATTGAIGNWTITGSALTATGITMTGGSGAGLAFGATPPTSASSGTGIWLDQTGLYGLSSGATQIMLDATTGQILAGLVTISSTGLALAVNNRAVLLPSVSSDIKFGPSATPYGTLSYYFRNIGSTNKSYLYFTAPNAQQSIGTIEGGGFSSAYCTDITGNTSSYSTGSWWGHEIQQGASASGIYPTKSAPANFTSGTMPPALTVTGGTHTGLLTTVEYSDVWINLNRIVTFAAGNISTNRAILIQPPTYAFNSTSTIANAATIAISGAPAAGTNATILNAWALWVQSGKSYMQGGLVTPTIAPQSDGTTAVQITKADGTTGVLTVDTSTPRVTIGAPPYPTNDLHVYAAAATIMVESTTTLGSASGGAVRVNTNSMPTAANQKLGLLVSGVNNAGSWMGGPRIQMFSSAAWATGAGATQPSYMTFDTISAVTQTERMRLTPYGALLIGKTSTNASDASGLLEVADNAIVGSAFGTEPVGNNPIEAHTSAAGNGIVAFNTYTPGTASGGIIRAAYGGIPSAADQRLGLLIYGATTTGSTQTSTAGISGWSAESWDSTHAGAYLRLETTATASTSRTERLRVTAAGATRIGGGAMTNTDAAGNLEVTGSSFLLGDLTMADAKNIILNATTGTQIGTAITQKLAFYGSTPTAQRANANQAAAPAGGTGATAGAYDTAAHRDALINLVNEMRTVLVNLGLMKGSA